MAGTGIDGEPGIVTKISPRPVTGTVSRLTELLQARDLKLFAVIDQRAKALGAGLSSARSRWSSSAARQREGR